LHTEENRSYLGQLSLRLLGIYQQHPLNWSLEHPWIQSTVLLSVPETLHCCTGWPGHPGQVTTAHRSTSVTRSLLQLHPSAKSARTRDATVPMVIPSLSSCVNRIARLPSRGPGPHHPFGRLHLQTRPCSASMFPSGNFLMHLRTSWVVGCPWRLEGWACRLGAHWTGHSTRYFISAGCATDYLSPTTKALAKTRPFFIHIGPALEVLLVHSPLLR
jgi:hypothetical protein